MNGAEATPGVLEAGATAKDETQEGPEGDVGNSRPNADSSHEADPMMFPPGVPAVGGDEAKCEPGTSDLKDPGMEAVEDRRGASPSISGAAAAVGQGFPGDGDGGVVQAAVAGTEGLIQEAQPTQQGAGLPLANGDQADLDERVARLVEAATLPVSIAPPHAGTAAEATADASEAARRGPEPPEEDAAARVHQAEGPGCADGAVDSTAEGSRGEVGLVSSDGRAESPTDPSISATSTSCEDQEDDARSSVDVGEATGAVSPPPAAWSLELDGMNAPGQPSLERAEEAGEVEIDAVGVGDGVVPALEAAPVVIGQGGAAARGAGGSLLPRGLTGQGEIAVPPDAAVLGSSALAAPGNTEGAGEGSSVGLPAPGAAVIAPSVLEVGYVGGGGSTPAVETVTERGGSSGPSSDATGDGSSKRDGGCAPQGDSRQPGGEEDGRASLSHGLPAPAAPQIDVEATPEAVYPGAPVSAASADLGSCRAEGVNDVRVDTLPRGATGSTEAAVNDQQPSHVGGVGAAAATAVWQANSALSSLTGKPAVEAAGHGTGVEVKPEHLSSVAPSAGGVLGVDRATIPQEAGAPILAPSSRVAMQMFGVAAVGPRHSSGNAAGASAGEAPDAQVDVVGPAATSQGVAGGHAKPLRPNHVLFSRSLTRPAGAGRAPQAGSGLTLKLGRSVAGVQREAGSAPPSDPLGVAGPSSGGLPAQEPPVRTAVDDVVAQLETATEVAVAANTAAVAAVIAAMNADFTRNRGIQHATAVHAAPSEAARRARAGGSGGGGGRGVSVQASGSRASSLSGLGSRARHAGGGRSAASSAVSRSAAGSGAGPGMAEGGTSFRATRATRGSNKSHDRHDDMMHAMCMICLEKLSDPTERGGTKVLGLLDSCSHRYCYPVSRAWREGLVVSMPRSHRLACVPVACRQVPVSGLA